MDYNGSIIWNPKHFSFWVINTDIMSFQDNDLKDACLPILAPVIDQIWSVVLANPGRYVIGICTVASGVTGDRGVNTAELPLGFHSSHICSSFVLPFLLCSLPTSFYAWGLPMFWTPCPTLLPHYRNWFLLKSESFPFILLFCQCHSDISKVNHEYI